MVDGAACTPAAWTASAEALSEVSGWSLVRYLPAAAATWHFATDNLVGTQAYTAALSTNGGWSVVFPAGFDEYFIMSADETRWVHFPRSSLATLTVSEIRLVYSASSVQYPDVFMMHNRAAQAPDPVIACVKSTTNAAVDTVYAEALDVKSDPAKGSLVFVRTRPPCELRGEAETLTGMRDWMQIKHIPARVHGGPNTAAFGNTFAYGISRTVSTGTRHAGLAVTDAEWAEPFFTSVGSAVDYYLFLFRRSEASASNRDMWLVYTNTQMAQETNNRLIIPYLAVTGVDTLDFGIMYNRINAAMDPWIMGVDGTMYMENAETTGRQAYSIAVFQTRSAHARSACCAAGSFHTSSPATVPLLELGRALALVPGSTRVPRLAALLGRDAVETRSAAAADMPSYNATAGPGGGGVLRFDRSARQFLDGGAHVFHIAIQKGFTAVALVKFTGALEGASDAAGGWNERVFGFGVTSGMRQDIVLHRDLLTGRLVFAIFEPSAPCTATSVTPIAQDAWVQIVVRYVTVGGFRVFIRVDAQTEVATTCAAGTDRVSAVTHVGQGPLGTFPFQGDIAGLFAVDAPLTTAQTAAILARMRAGQDTLSSCEFCGAGLAAPRGSLGAAACGTACSASASWIPGTTTCACDPGFTSAGPGCEACPAGEYKVLAGPQACDACPDGETSTEGSVSSAACVPPCAAGGEGACLCAAGEFSETRVLNPPYAQRTYSSFSGTMTASMLDDLSGAEAWAAQYNTPNQWLQMDAGAPMLITGLVTQGRGSTFNHFVSEFTVEHRLLAGDAPVAVPASLFNADRSKREHPFPSPVYARYVRVLAKAWTGAVSMRAALLVRTCAACLPGQASLMGSTSAAACQCAANAFLDPSAAANRAIALLPGTAQFSTRARRGARAYAATAVFDGAAGPPTGRGAVTFDRAAAQYLDGGAHTFSIATHGGFTAVAVVRFPGAAASNERVFDFGSAGANNNIILERDGAAALRFSIFNAGSATCTLASAAVLTQNTWVTVVAIYTDTNRGMQLRVGGVSATPTACTSAQVNRDVDATNVGKNIATGNYLGGSVAGLYAVDAALPEAEIAALIARMHRGEDPLQACADCPAHALAPPGSAGEQSCQCAGNSPSAPRSARIAAAVQARAVVVQPARAQLAALAGRDTALVDLKTGGTGWRLVRYLPPTSTHWYSGNDNLVGTLPRGTAYDYFSEWSVHFGEFDEFCFSTSNFRHWLQCTKTAASAHLFAISARDVMRSSIDANPYTAIWYHRAGQTQDPQIGLRNHSLPPVDTDDGDRMMYSEIDAVRSLITASRLTSLVADGGLNVWVRRGGTTNKPAVAPAAGPGGGRALVFDRAQAQFLDGGARIFNIASNRGFTAVAVVMFTGAVGDRERVFDFANGVNNDNIFLARKDSTAILQFGINNVQSTCAVDTTNGPILQDTWMTIAATYNDQDKHVRLTVGGTTSSFQCNSGRTDRTVSMSMVARSVDASAPYFNGTIAGLYAVDSVLSTEQIATLAASMLAGADPQRDVCRACPAGEVPGPDGVCGPPPPLTWCRAGSAPDAARLACVACPAGQYKSARDLSACLLCPAGTARNTTAGTACAACPAGRIQPLLGQTACVGCPAGRYRSAGGANVCALCPAGTASNTTAAAACRACPAGQIQTREGHAACVDCPADHFRETASSASLHTDCTPCYANSFSAPGAALETDCRCNAGFW